jgi:hypothetical protein
MLTVLYVSYSMGGRGVYPSVNAQKLVKPGAVLKKGGPTLD